MKILKLELRSNYKSFIVWTIACGILMGVYIAVFPMMKGIDYTVMFDQMKTSMPEGLVEMFGMNNINNLSDFSSYLSMIMAEMNIALVIYGAYLGSVILVKEESEGTIEYLYSMPVTRTQIVIEKLLAIVLLYISFIVMNCLVCVIGSCFVTSLTSTIINNIIIVFLGSLLSGSVYMLLGFLASTLLRSTKQAMALSIGMVMATFIIGSMSGVTKEIDWLRYISPIKYGEAATLIQSGWSMEYCIIAFLMMIISFLSAYFIYKRKDFKV